MSLCVPPTPLTSFPPLLPCPQPLVFRDRVPTPTPPPPPSPHPLLPPPLCSTSHTPPLHLSSFHPLALTFYHKFTPHEQLAARSPSHSHISLYANLPAEAAPAATSQMLSARSHVRRSLRLGARVQLVRNLLFQQTQTPTTVQLVGTTGSGRRAGSQGRRQGGTGVGEDMETRLML